MLLWGWVYDGGFSSTAFLDLQFRPTPHDISFN